MADYVTDGAVPSTGGALSSAVMRTALLALANGFVKVAPYTGHGGEIVAINAGGTAQESLATTGTGNVVRATSPTLTTPLLGTPTSGTLTNCTGLPISTGVSGLGTGIATALAVNSGSAGAPVLFNGAGGTPTSIVLTNATGTAANLTAGTANNWSGSGTISGTNGTFSGALTSSSPTAGIGYAAGAGGTVTQVTSLITTVTLNTICGLITTFAGSYAADSGYVFLLNNSTIASTDTIILNWVGITTMYDLVLIPQVHSAGGAAFINIRNVGAGGSSTNAKYIRFVVIKSVTL